MTERIGYIGLGIMGRGMARNLLKAGFPLTVWNRTASRMDDLVAEGAIAGTSPADVAASSNSWMLRSPANPPEAIMPVATLFLIATEADTKSCARNISGFQRGLNQGRVRRPRTSSSSWSP